MPLLMVAYNGLLMIGYQSGHQNEGPPLWVWLVLKGLARVAIE